MLFPGDGDDDFRIRQASLEFLAEPFDGVVIAMDEEDFLRCEFDGVVGDGVAGGVTAEVEDAHLAVERHGGKRGIEHDHVAVEGGAGTVFEVVAGDGAAEGGGLVQEADHVDEGADEEVVLPLVDFAELKKLFIRLFAPIFFE